MAAERTLGNATAGSVANLTDAAKFTMTDANGATRSFTLAEVRDELNDGAQAFSAGTAGAAAEVNRISKKVTAIANNSATAVLTITIPNAAHSASVLVRLTGSLGAGGAIGANEATGVVSYLVSVARTAGVNADADISSAFGAANSAVSGAATVTVTAAMSSVSGAVGAVNTFTVNVTIARSGGSSDNHTCAVYAEVQNGNATGVTLS